MCNNAKNKHENGTRLVGVIIMSTTTKNVDYSEGTVCQKEETKIFNKSNYLKFKINYIEHYKIKTELGLNKDRKLIIILINEFFSVD